MKKFYNYFIPRIDFNEKEWILKYQITALLLLSFCFGLGMLPFSIVRFGEGNYVVSISQLFMSIVLLYGFWRLQHDKEFYHIYSIIFFILFFLYIITIFFNVPQNSLNILWIIAAPILIFFFLNKSGGIVMFILVVFFILYLILSKYPYNIAEYVTLIGAFLTTTFIMYIYEFVKESEKKRILNYNIQLKKEVEKKTKQYKLLNNHLQERIAKEVVKQIEQEQMLLIQCRMASMGQMMAAIAHQWRQPLMNINAILLNIDHAIQNQPINQNYLNTRVDEIASITTHMSQTIEDFRHLLTPKQEKSSFLLHESILEVLELLKNNLKSINIQFDHDKTPLLLHGYKSEMIQVLIILFSNAIEILKIRNIKDKKIKITLNSNETDIYIVIEDNAKGIKDDILDKIFDPYFTTKEQTGGTGLGLYIAKIIIEHNFGGKLSVQNTSDGAQFSITVSKKDHV